MPPVGPAGATPALMAFAGAAGEGAGALAAVLGTAAKRSTKIAMFASARLHFRLQSDNMLMTQNPFTMLLCVAFTYYHAYAFKKVMAH